MTKSFPTFFMCLFSLFLMGPLHASAETVELDRIVAIVNNDIITYSALQNEVRTVSQQLRQQRAAQPLPPNDVLQKQVLERLIVKELQLQLADSTGIRVDDETLNKTTSRIAADNKLTLQQFRDALTKEGYDFAVFREDIRKEIILTRLRERQINSRISVGDSEIANFQATSERQGNKDTEFHMAQILISVPDAASPEKLQELRNKAQQVLERLRSGSDFTETAIAVSDGQQALQGGDLGWRKSGELPTLFTDIANKLQPGQLSDLIRSPSGFHIVKLIGVRDNEPHIVEQTLARHILIRTNELTTDEDAQRLLVGLKQRAKAGEDFAKLAQAHSTDLVSAADGGSLGWSNSGDNVPLFEEIMNKTTPGTISEPFKTNFGWHIVKVEERREIDNTAEFQRKKIRDLIRQRKIEEETETWLRRLRDEAYVEYRL